MTSSSTAKATILVAEDEPFLREIIHMSLVEHGADVELAGNGEEAIEAIDRHQPSLLLLDLLMPKVDGYAVLSHIRKQQYTFPVLILSNLSDPAEREKCQKLGVLDFIVKSNLDEDALWGRVEKFL